jgi:hypothetical protein
VPIEVFSDDDYRGSDEMVVTIDKSKRIYMNKAVQDFFGHNGKELKLFIGWDSVNKRICFAKPEIVKLPGKRPSTFGKYAFVSARRFIERFKIDLTDAPLHFKYVGQDGDWYCFQLVGYKAPDTVDVV